jgi:hypothetical protein
MAPVMPAASAKGTVNPSAMPMTTSRTLALAVKCDSTCGELGMNNSSEDSAIPRFATGAGESSTSGRRARLALQSAYRYVFRRRCGAPLSANKIAGILRGIK